MIPVIVTAGLHHVSAVGNYLLQPVTMVNGPIDSGYLTADSGTVTSDSGGSCPDEAAVRGECAREFVAQWQCGAQGAEGSGRSQPVGIAARKSR